MSNLFGLEGVVSHANSDIVLSDDITGEVALEGFFEASAALEIAMTSQDKYNHGLENLTRLVSIACTEKVDAAFCKLAGAELGAALRLGTEAITPDMSDAQKDRLQAACEGVLADWWEKIKAFFRMLWEKIKSFFKWLFSSAYRRNQAIVKLKEKFKNAGKLDETAFADKLMNTYSAADFAKLYALVTEITGFKVEAKIHELIAKLDAAVANTTANTDQAIEEVAKSVPALPSDLAEKLSMIGLRENEAGDAFVAAKSDMIVKEERTVAKHGWTTSLIADYLGKHQDLNDSTKALKAFEAKNQEAIKLATEAINKLEQKAKSGVNATDADKKKVEDAARKAAASLQKRQMVYTRLTNEAGKLIVNLTSVVISLGNAVPVKK